MRFKNFLIPLMCLLFAFFLEMPLSSSSMNVQTLKGEVSLVEHKEVTKIHASNDSVIQYNSFEVKEGEEVKIIQPSNESILVIQVNSDQPTRIKSKLSANGIVYIVNPHGIFIDKTALVEKGTFYFIGSELLTKSVKDALNIKATSGDVVNHGQIITQGEVHLIGRHVVNSGLIDAAEKVKISHTNAKNQLSILHTGTIKSKDIFIEARDGVCEIYGKIDAKNSIEQQYGGNICVLGQHVRLIGAYLDASGTFRGGQINLGGDFEGKGPLFKATRTSVDNTSVLDASAIEYGPGGEVVLWSKELTSFQGEIFARGGRKYGAGGRVETSSKNQLGIYSGKVNVDAACGEAGVWMLDPSNIVISNAEDATDDLSLVTEYPPKSGSQVTVNVEALNNFSGGVLEISATNRITVDADISNISSTLNLTLRAGNQIRFKNESIYVPNGKISFIVENKESGQIICSKDFKTITAHQMVMVAPKGEGNGFQVETNNLVLNPTHSNRSEPTFVFNTDVTAKNNSEHKLYFQKSKGSIGRIEIEGSLLGFEVVDSETNLKVFGRSQVSQLYTKGASSVELLGGGEIFERVDFDNTRGITLGGNAKSILKINNSVNTTQSLTKLCGQIDIKGSFEAEDVKLLGNASVNTFNNPFIVHQNVAQENTLANLSIKTEDAHVTVEGSLYLNDLKIQSNVAPVLCGEVCVCNFRTNAPELKISHDLIVSGHMDCFNLSTSGENKKVAFAKGGSFKGKTEFSHSGTTTLGDDAEASFNFDEMLDTHKSITYSHGLIYVNGPVEMKELSLLGDTTIQCYGASCNISGSIDQQNTSAQLNIDTKNDQITFGNHIRVEGLTLNTSSPLNITVPVEVTTFSTNSPNIYFSNHLTVEGFLSCNNLTTEGSESQVSIYGGAKINGSAEFNNQMNLTFGKDEKSEFVVNNRFSCKSTKAFVQGKFDVMGQVDLYDLELLDHTSFLTHGYHFNVEKDVAQNNKAFNFAVNSEAGVISFGDQINVSDLTLNSSSAVYIKSKVDVENLNTTSPLITFAGDTYVNGKIDAKSIVSVGHDKKLQINQGGKIQGDAKISNGSTFIFGQSSDDTLELSGTFDRSNGHTIAQGTLRTHAAAIDVDSLTLSGKLNILSISNDGEGQTIAFHSQVNGAYPLTINAGNSKVVVKKSFGDEVALGGLHVYANEMNAKSDMTIDGGSCEFYTNITLANNIKIDDFGKNGLFFYGKVNGDYDLNAYSNTLIVIKKDVGSQEELNSVNLTAKRIDVWGSIAANSGAISFDGDVELCENVKFVNQGIAGISFNGKVDGDFYLEVKVNDKNGKISFNEDIGVYQPIRHIVLATQNPVLFNKKLDVDHFETTAPSATFMSDVVVAGNFNANNVIFDGARQNVSLMGGGEILGNATFNNKGDLCLGDDDSMAFTFAGIFSRINGPTYARGTLNTNGIAADFNALYAVGDLKLVSTNEEGTCYNFNSTFDGNHRVSIDAKKGSVYFYDYVGNHHPLNSLDVNAKTVSMQREINVREGLVTINADLNLLNHSKIKSSSIEGIHVAGTVNGEWNIAFEAEGDVEVKGAIGMENPVNHLIIETPKNVKFDEKVKVYNLKSTSPLITFNQDVEIKKQINTCSIVMANQEGCFTLLGGGVVKGNFELGNVNGVTVIGDSQYSNLTTDGQIVILSQNTYAQGLIQSVSEPINMQKLNLNGALKVSSCANNSKGSVITFKNEIDGSQALVVNSGEESTIFANAVGLQNKLTNLNVKGSLIHLNGNISVLEGSTVFDGNVELKKDIQISDEGVGVISFLGQVNGDHVLDLSNKHEMGRVTFAKAVGNKEALKSLNIETLSQVEFPMQFEALALNTTAPNLVFADEATIYNEINANNLLTSGKYRTVRFLGNGNFSGVTTFSNTGSLVLGNSDSSQFNFAGQLHVLNSILMTQGNFKTKGSVSLKELTLKGNTHIETAGHLFNVQGSIEQLEKSSDLSVDTGEGSATFGSKIAINNLSISTNQPMSFHHDIYVADFKTTAPSVLFSSNTTINGAINANNINTAGTENKCSLLGGGQVKGNAIFKNGNGLYFGADEDSVLTFYGPIDTTCSLLETKGTIQTVGKTIDLGNIEVVGNTTIRSNSKGSDGKDIYFLGAVNGPRQLRANAGKAKISFENDVGENTALESLQATASKIEVDCDINSKDGSVIFAGDVVFTNTSNLTANGEGNIIFQGTVNVDNKALGPVNLILDATGKVEFQKDVGDSKAFNEVVVTRAGEIICRSPLKSNIITQSKGTKEQPLEAKKEKATVKPDQSKIETVEAKEESVKKEEKVIHEV